MANIECASLILRTCDLTPGSSIGVGTCATNLSYFTFNNIDLRTVLGDMYYRYDLFNICLTTMASGVSSTCTSGNGTTFGSGDFDNLSVLINIGGLPFKNNTYSQSFGHNISFVPIATYQFPSGSATYQNYNNPKFVTFGKAQDQLNLSISYLRVKDCSQALSTLAYPNVVFMFSIFGIPRDPGNMNGQRIIM